MSLNVGYILEIPGKLSGTLVPRQHPRPVKLESHWGSVWVCVRVYVSVCVGGREVEACRHQFFFLSSWGDSIIYLMLKTTELILRLTRKSMTFILIDFWQPRLTGLYQLPKWTLIVNMGYWCMCWREPEKSQLLVELLDNEPGVLRLVPFSKESDSKKSVTVIYKEAY